MTFLASLTEEIADKVEGYYIIKTKEELDKVIVNTKQNNKVIIRRDFAQEYFTPSGLMKFKKNAEYINRNIIIELDEHSDILTEDKFKKKVVKATSIEELISLAVTYPKEFMDTIKSMSADDSARRNELLVASNKVSRLQAIIDEKNMLISDLQSAVNMEQANKINSQMKLDALIKRINYQYNADVDESKMFSVDKNSFDKIIYIKEITRVQFVDSLVYYLKEIFKVLYSMPTRLTVIEGYYADGRTRLYPNLVPHYKLKERDVLSGDILMLGMQPHLMSDILKNPNNVSILIVLDRGGYMSPHIRGMNVEYFYTASDINDIPQNIPRSRIISYNEETLYIPLIEGFEELDDSEKMSKYSSTEIVKRITALIEGRSTNGGT